MFMKKKKCKQILLVYLIPYIFFRTLIMHNLKSSTKFFYTFNFFAILFYLYLTTNKPSRKLTKNSEQIEENIARQCGVCLKFRHSRVYHCLHCCKCSFKPYYHSYYIKTCINGDNLANFIRLIFIFKIFLIFNIIIYYSELHYLIFSNRIHRTKTIALYFFTILFFLFFIFLEIFFSFIYHIKLVMFNLLPIEIEILQRIDELILEDKIFYFKFGKKYFNPFDRGKINNLVNCLGKPYFLFLIGGNVKDGVDQIIKILHVNWPDDLRKRYIIV
ncbi:hypothetical protein TUBRATIS_009160 [Tubulinosema ratisbonensis]|uniref:Palmitoyltransferase n=1 Tax=Tubulinosema ratisbonensis TaxID=291195 RepID=A0A437ANH3_9MICR|nr:hypothetical protein TUBRATIS_009160 [Tubulinosema ratisbonensis]